MQHRRLEQLPRHRGSEEHEAERRAEQLEERRDAAASEPPLREPAPATRKGEDGGDNAGDSGGGGRGVGRVLGRGGCAVLQRLDHGVHVHFM